VNEPRSELTVHDALVGEILGELVLVRKGVEEFKSALPPMLDQVKEAGELVSLRLAEQARYVVAELDDRTAKLNAAANEFRDVREQLMGELGVKTAQQFETVLSGVSKRMAGVRRVELVIVGLICSAVTAALVISVEAVLKHI
jgi:uncharacterized lipoprotein